MAKVELSRAQTEAEAKELEKIFPSNSYKSRENRINKKIESELENHEMDRKDPKRVANGKRRPKTLGMKMKETFLGEMCSNIGSFIMADVVIPTFKDLIWDVFTGSLDMWLGGDRSKPTHRNRKQNTSYHSVSYMDDRPSRNISQINRARHNFDDITFETRREAEDVLGNLVDLIYDYGEATVADFYTYSGIETSHADHKHGWEDLQGSKIVRSGRNGYVIKLPRTISLGG